MNNLINNTYKTPTKNQRDDMDLSKLTDRLDGGMQKSVISEHYNSSGDFMAGMGGSSSNQMDITSYNRGYAEALQTDPQNVKLLLTDSFDF